MSQFVHDHVSDADGDAATELVLGSYEQRGILCCLKK